MAATTTRSENVALARRLLDAFATGDLDAARTLLHPAVQVIPSLDGGRQLEGVEAVTAWWRSLAANGANVEARPLDFEVSGDCVIVRGYMRHNEGRMLSERMVFWVYEIRDGQITRIESRPTREAALARV